MPTDQENIHNQQYNTIRNLAIVALRENAWIFDCHSKEWHDPETFEDKYLNAPYAEGWYHRFKVMNPIQGLNAADTQIQKIIEKKQELQKRVLEYYQSKLK